MSFSTSVIEREYLVAAPSHEVLRLLDRRAQKTKGSLFSAPAVQDEVATALYERNDRVVDLGLARAASPKIVARVIERRCGGLQTGSICGDEAALIAALSGASVYQFYRESDWLEASLGWVAEHGSKEMLEALFMNPSVPDSVVQNALNKQGVFQSLEGDRRLLVAALALRSERVREGVNDTSDGPDLDGWSTAESVWDFVASVDPLDEASAATLAYLLPDVPGEIRVPDRFENREIEHAKRDYAKEELDFLQYLLDRWTPANTEGVSSRVLKHIREVREQIAAHASLFRVEVRKLLSEHSDLYVRRGFYRSVSFMELEELKKFHEQDGDAFCEAAARNPFFALRRERRLAVWFNERLDECKPAKREYDDTPSDIFDETMRVWSEKEPDRYFANRWEILDPTAAQEASTEEVQGAGSPMERLMLTKLNELSKTLATVAHQKYWLGWGIAMLVGFILGKL